MKVQIPVVPGEQVWLLVRTDRDGVSASEIVDMAGPAMLRFLRPAHGTAEPWEIISTGTGEYRIGPARPIKIEAVTKERPELPAGRLLADRQTAFPDIIPTVRATLPWWVLVRFWWRAPASSTDFPALRVDWLGGRHYELAGADWLLDRAVQIPPEQASPDPGEESWGEVQWRRTENLVKVGGASLFGLGLLAAAGYLWVTRRKRP